MFKEILHYTFRHPRAAFDISGFNHHGAAISVDHSADGAESGSGAYRFDRATSRVHVPPGNAWDNLGALKIEALVRIDGSDEGPPGHLNVLVEGHLSFALVIAAGHVARGYVLVPTEPERPAPDDGDDPTPPDSHSIFSWLRANPDPDEPDVGFRWIEVSSLPHHAPDGIIRRLETDVWTRVTLVHNGFSLQLWFDDELVGYRDDVEFGVLSVQPGGISIGSGLPIAAPRLRGALDSVRIWKFDPSFLKKHFFCRPMDAATRICWQALYEHLIRLRSDPETARPVLEASGCLGDALDDLLRAIYRQGAGSIARLEAFRRRYEGLWCDGSIDGPEMERLLAEFGEWLDRVAGTAFAAAAGKLLGCREALYRCGQEHDLTCIGELDGAWSNYARLIGEHALPGYCSPPFRPAPEKPDDSYPPKRRC